MSKRVSPSTSPAGQSSKKKARANPPSMGELRYSSQSTSALIDPDYSYVVADLSSFAHDPFLFNGVVYATVEHAFHAHKCKQAAHLFDSQHPLYVGDDPRVAKRTGGRKYFEQHGYTLRSDWNTFRVELMGDLLNARTLQCAKSHNALKLTGNKQLLHAGFRIDTFWGVQRKGGSNMHGKLLMQARALCTDLRKEPTPSGGFVLKRDTIQQCLRASKMPRKRNPSASDKRASREHQAWVAETKQLLRQVQHEASVCLQRVWRGYRVRRDAATLKALQTRNLCMHVVQTPMPYKRAIGIARSFAIRDFASSYLVFKRHAHSKASKIQAWWRGMPSRRRGMPTGMPKFMRALEQSGISAPSKKRLLRLLRKKVVLRRQVAVGEPLPCVLALHEMPYAAIESMLRDPVPAEFSDVHFLKQALRIVAGIMAVEAMQRVWRGYRVRRVKLPARFEAKFRKWRQPLTVKARLLRLLHRYHAIDMNLPRAPLMVYNRSISSDRMPARALKILHALQGMNWWGVQGLMQCGHASQLDDLKFLDQSI